MHYVKTKKMVANVIIWKSTCIASNPGFHLQHHTQAKRQVLDISACKGKSLENHKFIAENLRLFQKKKSVLHN